LRVWWWLPSSTDDAPDSCRVVRPQQLSGAWTVDGATHRYAPAAQTDREEEREESGRVWHCMPVCLLGLFLCPALSLCISASHLAFVPHLSLRCHVVLVPSLGPRACGLPGTSMCVVLSMRAAGLKESAHDGRPAGQHPTDRSYTWGFRFPVFPLFY